VQNMSGFVLHVGASVQCSDLGQAQPQSSFGRVLLSGQEVITIRDRYAITNCSLASTSTPPCLTGQFTRGAARVFAGGSSVATLDSQSTCTPTGTPLRPLSAQQRVRAM
jgi:hypothetical protein